MLHDGASLKLVCSNITQIENTGDAIRVIYITSSWGARVRVNYSNKTLVFSMISRGLSVDFRRSTLFLR